MSVFKIPAFVVSVTVSLVVHGMAAPSIEMPHEWAAPLEFGSGVVLVQAETGQMRIIRFDENFEGSDRGAIATNLPRVTGLNTGLDRSEREQIIISSVSANGIKLISSSDFSQTLLQPSTPGPVTAIPVRQQSTDDSSVLTLGRYGDTAQVLERYTDLFHSQLALGPPTSAFPVHDLQPSKVPGRPDQQAGIASINISGSVGVYEAFPTEVGMIYQLIEDSTGGVAEDKIASMCMGKDGRQCVLRYLPGATQVDIVTQDDGVFASGNERSNSLPFAIGRIIAIPSNVPDAADGVLITSEDGSSAIYARIILGKTLEIQETFESSEDKIFTGLIPVGGLGFLILEGPAETGMTEGWRGLQFNGSSWEEVSSGGLSPWLPVQENFATMFWFNGTPLVDPTAEIVAFETRADWTRKLTTDPVPNDVELSLLTDPVIGLKADSLITPMVPAGASFLITSQYEAKVSITALDNDLAIQSPSLSITPASGAYPTSVTVSALFDPGANVLFYRENRPGSAWSEFDRLTVGSSSSWLFYIRNQETGFAGPIVRRDYNFDPAILNELDADRDGVPDYVERELGLDPAGGADSDGDFQSDLEEILAGTDASDPTSNTPPEDPRNPPFLGEGFQLIAQAFDGSGRGASPQNDFNDLIITDDFAGETLRLFDQHGNLLAQENVRKLSEPSALDGEDGAPMDVGTPVPEDAWVTLVTPVTFNVLDLLNAPRHGREIYKVMKRPVNPVARVETIPTGTNREEDAAAWINAAKIAHSNHETVDAITEIRPVDNAVSALAEQAVFDSLSSLDPDVRAALGVPDLVEDFTLYPQRRGESSLTGFSREMWEALLDAGCDFCDLIELLEPAGDNLQVRIMASNLTNRHRLISDDNPLMALPLDAFRSIIRNGAIVDPAPGDPARTNPYNNILTSNIDAVKATFDGLLSQVGSVKRPTETWSLVIGPSTTPLREYDYLRQGTSEKVWLVDRFGEPELLEQGLGLPLGAIFEVSGYTDVSGPDGFQTLEIIRIKSVMTPLASDSDGNGNLLDDDWENVFFGDLGVVGPFDHHPDSGHSYLQYFLSGGDPRSGSLEGPVVNLMPDDISYVWIPGADAYDLTFEFPAEYVEFFDFIVRSSEDISGFANVPNIGGLQTVSPGVYRFRLKTSESNLPANFFRIGISLRVE